MAELVQYTAFIAPTTLGLSSRCKVYAREGNIPFAALEYTESFKAEHMKKARSCGGLWKEVGMVDINRGKILCLNPIGELRKLMNARKRFFAGLEFHFSAEAGVL